MALDRLSEAELQAKEAELLKAISDNGGSMGNTSLMRALGWPEEEYWELRERLVAAGRVTRGQGKGGSTRLVPAPVAPSVSTAPAVSAPGAAPDHVVPKRMREDELYAPVAEVLRTTWAKDQGFREVVAEITAHQGKRDTGGRWTRPDVTVASMTTLLYVPSKLFDVATFELKPADAVDVTSVYEALAHRRAATRSYVWLHLSEAEEKACDAAGVLGAIHAEAKRHGIGVIVAEDPSKYETWDEQVEPVRIEPDPSKLNDFIATQFAAGAKEEILKWMR